MKLLNDKTAELTDLFRNKGFSVIEMWEHHFIEDKSSDPDLRNFLKTHDIQDHLNPRDAFFGGRTNGIQLYYEGNARYVDFTSLYPWTNKYCR